MDTATPAAPAAPATPVPAVATVTLPKEQVDQLQRDAARASANQRKADLYDKTVGKPGKGHFQPTAPATPPSKEEMDARAEAEDRKAERGLLALAADPTLREVFDADPTLRDMITKNPLAVLPIYANDALDAEDAITLVKEALVAKKKPAAPATPPTPPTPPAPPAGGINPPGDQAVNAAIEVAKKNQNTEHAVAGMLGARLKAGGKK